MRHIPSMSIIRYLGVSILVIGLQFWAFQQSISSHEQNARENLEQLRLEMLDNRHRDGLITELTELEQRAPLDAPAGQALQRMLTLLRSLPVNAAETTAELALAAADFQPNLPEERDALAAVRQHVTKLEGIYANHYAVLRDQAADPAWYFLPAALLWPGRGDAIQAFEMNHALYLVLIGKRGEANAVLADLAESTSSSELHARVRFTQARLHYDSFRAEGRTDYLRSATEYARESVMSDSSYTLAKSFLDFLLATHSLGSSAQTSPVLQQGTGEGEGKQGSVMPVMREF